MACFADIVPSPNDILISQDRLFTRIFQEVVRQSGASVETFTKEGISRLLQVYKLISEDMCSHFHALSKLPNWSQQMFQLESSIDTGLKSNKEELSEDAKKIVDILTDYDLTDISETKKIHKVILKKPRLSSFLPQLVNAFFEFISKDENREKIDAKLTENQDFEYRIIAEKYYPKILSSIDSQSLRIEDLIKWRLLSAEYFFNLRSITLIDILNFIWPSLGQILRSGKISFLKDLQIRVTNPGLLIKNDMEIVDEEEEQINKYLNDHKLREFLKLKPYFKDINPKLIENYFTISGEKVAQKVDLEIPFLNTQLESKSTNIEQDSYNFTNLYISFEKIPDSSLIKIKAFDGGSGKSEEGKIDPTAKISDATFQTGYRDVGFKAEFDFLSAKGVNIYNGLFSNDEDGKLKEFVTSIITRNKRIRFVIVFADETLNYLHQVAWETIQIPEMNLIPALTRKKLQSFGIFQMPPT